MNEQLQTIFVEIDDALQKQYTTALLKAAYAATQIEPLIFAAIRDNHGHMPKELMIHVSVVS